MTYGLRILIWTCLCLAFGAFTQADERPFGQTARQAGPSRGTTASGPAEFGSAVTPSKPVARQAGHDGSRLSAPATTSQHQFQPFTETVTSPDVSVDSNGLNEASSAGRFETSIGTSGHVPIPLHRNVNADGTGGSGSRQPGASFIAILLTLIFVILIILGLAKLVSRKNPFAVRGVPVEAIDVMGRRTVDPRNSIYIVRVGSKILLLGASGNGLTTLSEVTDPVEVASLANFCRAEESMKPAPSEWVRNLFRRSAAAPDRRSFEERFTETLFSEAEQASGAPVTSISVKPPQEVSRAR